MIIKLTDSPVPTFKNISQIQSYQLAGCCPPLRSKLPRRTPRCWHWRGKLCCRTFQVDHGGGGVVLVLMVMMMRMMMCLHWRGKLRCGAFQVDDGGDYGDDVLVLGWDTVLLHLFLFRIPQVYLFWGFQFSIYVGCFGSKLSNLILKLFHCRALAVKWPLGCPASAPCCSEYG